MRASEHGRQAAGETPRWLVLVVMCVGYFLVLLDVTIVNVALPSIGAGLGVGVSGQQWVVDGYALALAALLLAGGTIGDLYGHKRVVLAGLGVFGLASIGCGLAPDPAALIGSRVGQGIGAALLLPGTLAIITRTFPRRAEQARAIGIWAGVGSVALPAGPLLGGALVTGIGWRAVFWLNVPIIAIAALAAVRVVRESREAQARQPYRAGPDWAGIALGGLLLAAVTFAVIAAGHDGPGPPVLAAIAVAVLCAAGFVTVERRVPNPMLPLALFRRPAFATANAAAGAMNLGTLGLLFLLTLYLQTVQHRSALAAGLALVPLFAPLAVLAPLAGRATARFGPKLPMATGLIIAATGVALLTRLHAGSPYLMLLPAMLAWGIGLGVLTPAVVSAAVGAVGPERAGLASGVNNTARQAGGAIGIAIYGALAGSPRHTSPFLTGLHTTALLTAALFTTTALATLIFIRREALANQAKPASRQNSRALGRTN